MESKDLERQLNYLAQKAFESYNWNFWPLFPNILIRVFDFEDTSVASRIIKPQTAQAPSHRAMVIRTWKPRLFNNLTIKSELEAGMIVTVPYYAGVPTNVESIDDAGYRIVPENKLRNYKTGKVYSEGSTQETPHIFFYQNLCAKDKCVESIIQLVSGAIDCSYIEEGSDLEKKLVSRILSDYDVVPKRISLVQS